MLRGQDAATSRGSETPSDPTLAHGRPARLEKGSVAVKDVEELHARITKEITEQRGQEMAELVARNRSERQAADKRATQGLEHARSGGLDIGKLEAQYKTVSAERGKELEAIKKLYAAGPGEVKRIAPHEFREHSLEAAIDPAAASLVPSFAAVFSSKDPQDKLAGGTGTDVPNYNIIDAWDWASGAGWGWAGSGAGSYQVWAEWGYWYWPATSRWYGITTHDRFRGYYIVRSFDDWWISAFSRVRISIWTQVYQYNWSPWASWNVLDVGSDNIDVNARWDNDIHEYYSVLLGGGDWAYIRNVVGLYVYARAGGSYAELNDAVGSANYLAAPHVHVY